MSANQDFVALDWIKADISETLEQAQHALESYAELSQDSSSIRTCLTFLHQVHGTLKMVQIEGPTDMALEMEAVAQALMNETVPDQGAAQEVLMQSILQMPGYLDRIQRDQQDIPDFVATVVDNLRVSRGAERLNRSASCSNSSPAAVAFNLDLLSAPTPAETIGFYKNQNGPETARKLRLRYQQSLMALLKKANPRENLTLMGKVFAKLDKISRGSPAGYLAQLGLALVEGIATGGVKLDKKSARLLKQIDGAFKILAEGDEAAIASPVSDDFANDLLHALSRASKKTARITTVLKLFNVKQESSVSSVADFGPDDETLAAVSRILIEEFAAITDKLDIYVSSSARNQQDLFDLLPDLEQVASALSVVGLVEHLRRVDHQLAVIRLLKDESAEPTEEQLLEMAGSLLEIQSNLNRVVGDTNDEGESDSFGDLDEAQAAVVRETRSGLAECKDNVIEFVNHNFSLDKLEGLPSLLKSLAGGLLIINQQRAGAVLEACSLYVERNLIRDRQQPALSEMDDLADAITSIDYYLERFLESAKDPYLQMISVAEEAIAKLGYNVADLANLKLQQASAREQEPEGVSELNIDSGEHSESATVNIDTAPVGLVEDVSETDGSVAKSIEVASSSESIVESPAKTILASTEEVVDNLIDDEIVEIFVEEVDEVLETISEYLPTWQTDVTDEDALTEIRRAFHTLKGSGRMVGATVVGELAWSIESLLNRIIENSVTATVEIQRLVVEVVTRIPEGIDAFKNQHQETFLVSHLIEQADAIGLATIPTEMNSEASAEPELSEEQEPSDLASTTDHHALVDDDVTTVFKLDELEMQLPDEETPDDAAIEISDRVESSLGSEEMGASAIIKRDSLQLDSLDLESIEPERLEQERLEQELLEQAFEDGDLQQPDVQASELRASELLESERLESERLEEITLADVELDDASEFTSIEQSDAVQAPSDPIEPEVAGQTDEVIDHDSELDEIFLREAIENMATVRAFLDNSQVISSGLIAAFHTLKGSGAMADVAAIANIAGPLESLSNKYFNSGKQADEEYVALVARASELIDLVITNLSVYRFEIEGSEAFQSQCEALSAKVDVEDSLPPFEFDGIILLGRFSDIISEWDVKKIEQLVEELRNVESQARSTEREPLITLTTSMLRCYSEITARPNVDVENLLINAHESLLVMFGNIAASQELDSPTEIIRQLDTLDFAAINGTIDETIDETNHQELLPKDQIDDEVLGIFLEEAEELNEAINQCVLDWASNPHTSEYYDNLLRHLHTMKGGARLAGLNSLGEYTHNFETFLISVQQNPVPLDEAFFATVNQRQDEIARRVGVYRKLVQGDAQPEELAAMTRDLDSTPTMIASAALPATQTSEEDSQEQSSEGLASQVSSDSALAAEVDSEKTATNQNQEMVRVSSELLEELIDLSGESNITRGRVEQQIRDFGESLQEMEDTINRIRADVRRLEIEAESRETVFHNTEHTGKSNFDDLEMDRYTMLQEISRTLNEGSSDMLDLKDTLRNKSRDVESLLHQQARIGTEIQEGLTRTRMVPIARLIPRLRRIVRQISAEVGKSVKFDAFNVEGELDRNVLEKIVAPLEHMLRNAVDHGIESSDKRLAANKPETGKISLRLSRESGYLVLNVSDDGGGINVDAVKRKAIERGVISADDEISDHEIMQFIMHAGFSTAEKVTQISGRGVGMDVVASEIKQLGGSVSIDSTLGLGTEFAIRIPFTVSINRALLVVVREETYAIPLNSIEGMVRVSPYELEAYYQPEAPLYEYAGQPYRLAYLGKMLEKSDDPDLTGQVSPLPVILASNAESAVALQVDRVIGSREVVVKSLGPQFSQVGGIAGATIMGDGNIVVILDLMALVHKADLREEGVQKVDELNEIARPRTRKIMIVDDSVTVRKVTTRLMERQGWEVTTAKDGVDAVNQLQNIYPDVVLLDIEMPKMDGFEVLRTVRRDPRLANLPIIMITSRTGEKHKQQALELGVNRFLGKPFQEANLISTIDEVIAESEKE
jgi:chemosensory pili system protein ChpA (sensor histidine kinase/response regulator)